MRTIPKRIIHIYCAPEGRSPELPLVCQASLMSAKLLHPSYEFLLFDKERMDAFMEQEFPEFRHVMASFRLPIQRFDFFRYLAVYRLGGFYLDLDIFLARNFEPLLGLPCVFSFEELTIYDHLRRAHQMDWELANYAFGAAPGDPFLRKVIENCVRSTEEPEWIEPMLRGIPRCFHDDYYVLVTTGPALVSRTFAENRDLQRNVAVVFPADVRDPRMSQRFGEFGVHLMQSSWRTRRGFLRSRLARFWETRRRSVNMRTSTALGPTRVGGWQHYEEPAGTPALR